MRAEKELAEVKLLRWGKGWFGIMTKIGRLLNE
jgi:hypothetical protein